MKNIKQFLIYLLFIITSSCTSEIETLENSNNTNNLVNYIYKTYNTNNGQVLDSINFLIQENKILSSIKHNSLTSNIYKTTYHYQNENLIEIKSYLNNSLDVITTFSYDFNGNLTQYLKENINTINQNSQFTKHDFIHNIDTIFSTTKFSLDGVNFSNSQSEYKIVIDNDNNRIYFEDKDNINNETTYKISTYDANNNLELEEEYLSLENQENTLNYYLNHNYNSGSNLFYKVNKNTYSKKTLMLLYHLQSNAINNINSKSISPNTLSQFSTSFGNSAFNFQINNTTNNDNQTIFSDFKTLISNELISHFSQEFIFD